MTRVELHQTHFDPRHGMLLLDLKRDPDARLAARQFARICMKSEPALSRCVMEAVDAAEREERA